MRMFIISITTLGTLISFAGMPVMAQNGIVHKKGASSRAEASRGQSLLPPLVDRGPGPAIPCPWLEGGLPSQPHPLSAAVPGDIGFLETPISPPSLDDAGQAPEPWRGAVVLKLNLVAAIRH
jgi:hypothetical protein